jgi:glycosyltransferase involved in cell wall biosynthesis
MQILILTPDIHTRGGIARYTATLALALGDLIGPENVHVQPLLGRDGSDRSFTGCRVLSPVSARLSTAGKLRFAFRVLGMGLSEYNLVICTHIGLSPVAGLMRLFFRTPFWVTCHGREAWPRFAADVRWAAGQADLLLPVSRFTAEMISRVSGIPQSKMRVLYNAIPDDFAGRLIPANGNHGSEAALNKKEKNILSVGTIDKTNTYKGFDTVIKALPRVLEAIPNARYLVVGEGNDTGRLKGLARDTGVLDHVKFMGRISDADLAVCYRACDVFVMPSRTRPLKGGGWQGEGFGRVYVEASLAGKPVVGSTGGGAAEAVLHERTGLLVDPESVPDVAGALIRLLWNHEQAAIMGFEGREWALEHFTSGALRYRLAELLRGYGFSPHNELAESGDTRHAFPTRKREPQVMGGSGRS